MHIYISAPTQTAQSQPALASTHPATTTSFETAKLETPHHYVEPVEKNHAPLAITATVQEAELFGKSESAWKDAPTHESLLSDSIPMFNKKLDDPTPLVAEEDLHENMKFRRFKAPLICRWLTNVRLQWRILFYLIVGLAVLVLLYAAMNRDTSSSSRIDDLRKSGGHISAVIEQDKSGIGRPPPKLKIDVYMESQCPDTQDFLDTQLSPTWNELKEYMNLQVIPFGKARWAKQGVDDFSFQCQHGQNECLVNQLMCCGIDKLKKPDLYLPYIVCLQMTQFGDSEQAKCAQQSRLSPQEMQTCAESKKGRQLHHQMGNMTKSLSPPLYFVPWVLIENKRDSSAVMDLKTAICKKLNLIGVKPAACDQIALTTALNAN